MRKRLFGLLYLSLFATLGFGQSVEQSTIQHLKGYWKGAFIKGNAQQSFEIRYYESDSTLYSLQTMEEWHPQFGEFQIPVTVDSTGIIRMNTGYGKVVLTLDSNNLEIIGFVEDVQPTMNVHLKKVPPPPSPNYTIKAVSIENGPIQLKGHLHIPKMASETAIIIVGGRGCYAGNTQFDLYAKVLRRYGITVLVYNKRGTGLSTGDCDFATISDLADDLIACKRYLESHPNKYTKVGVLGSSAGGWVMTKAQESTDFDFMISMVGPATSVKEQQLQSMEYGAAFYELPKKVVQNIETYTRLMLDADATPANFKKFQALLAKAEKENWKQLLEDTDIPANTADIANLWVQRHAYDPTEVLKKYNHPFLAIYGGIDWIVPAKENIAELEAAFSNERNSLLRTAIAHNAEHGTEVKNEHITLAEYKSYWHFFRISPQVLIEIVEFLRDNQFIE
ncbi:MAG: alpha/beta hydrolase [Bacteroidota bacterium]